MCVIFTLLAVGEVNTEATTTPDVVVQVITTEDDLALFGDIDLTDPYPLDTLPNESTLDNNETGLVYRIINLKD